MHRLGKSASTFRGASHHESVVLGEVVPLDEYMSW